MSQISSQGKSLRISPRQTWTVLLTFNVPITINLYSFYHDYHLTIAEGVSFAFTISKLLQ